VPQECSGASSPRSVSLPGAWEACTWPVRRRCTPDSATSRSPGTRTQASTKTSAKRIARLEIAALRASVKAEDASVERSGSGAQEAGPVTARLDEGRWEHEVQWRWVLPARSRRLPIDWHARLRLPVWMKKAKLGFAGAHAPGSRGRRSVLHPPSWRRAPGTGRVRGARRSRFPRTRASLHPLRPIHPLRRARRPHGSTTRRRTGCPLRARGSRGQETPARARRTPGRGRAPSRARGALRVGGLRRAPGFGRVRPVEEGRKVHPRGSCANRPAGRSAQERRAVPEAGRGSRRTQGAPWRVVRAELQLARRRREAIQAVSWSRRFIAPDRNRDSMRAEQPVVPWSVLRSRTDARSSGRRRRPVHHGSGPLRSGRSHLGRSEDRSTG